MLTPCTVCGACWDETGYYHYKGEIQQPCRTCRCDSQSIYYLNNHDAILAKQRATYLADQERMRAYHRDYQRQRRSQATASNV